jgi:hypothetical protein
VFIAIAVISVAATISDLLEINLMDRVIAGDNLTTADANANDNRQMIVGVFQFASLIAGAIVFIRWLTAAYRNADVVAPGHAALRARLGDRRVVRAGPRPVAAEADRQRRLARRRA